MNKLFTVAGQEFTMMAKTKTYLITTLLGPFLLAGLMILPGFLSIRSMSEEKSISLAVYSEDKKISSEIDELFSTEYESRIAKSREEALNWLDEEVVEGVLVISPSFSDTGKASYISRTGTDIQNVSQIEDDLDEYLLRKNIVKAGLKEDTYELLTQKANLSLTRAGSEREGNEETYMITLMISMVVVMLLYMTIYLYGFSIGRSVVRERNSNTVDLLLSSASPEEIMSGKLLGVGAAGLLQVSAWIGIILLAALYGGTRLPEGTLSLLSIGNLITIIPFFFLGFLLFGSAFLGIGSFSETDQQLQQAGIPLIVLLILPMISMSGLVSNPESLLMKILNIIPFTAPLTMPVRIMIGNPAVWELFLSMFLLILTIAVMIWLSARIFRVGILISGSAVKLKDVLRWTFRENRTKPV
jgi:ABC-2 type transport system permease protein